RPRSTSPLTCSTAPPCPPPEGKGKKSLAGREGEEGVRLAALGVLLETLDDEGPRVVDRAEIVLRHRGRPVGVTEQDTGLPVFGWGDVPGDGRAIPVGKVGKGRPFDPLSGLQLVDPHPLRRAAKTEGRNRAYRGLGLALRGPEGAEPFHGWDRLVGLVGSR